MKILLISPEIREAYSAFTPREMKALWFPRLGLATLAGLTPEHHQVFIHDESVEEIDFDRDVDLVGITTMTFLAPRAYEIAARFRERGVKVVLGGIHASTLPSEAIRHADSVLIGEAEEIWHTLLNDAERGELKRFYAAPGLPSLTNVPFPRRDLFRKDAYLTVNSVQTTRGCPYGCHYCSVSLFNGRKFRLRPIQEVVKELERLEDKKAIFIDDNIVGDRRYARELFRAIKPLNLTWGSQCSLNLGNDPDLLRMAAESGCVTMFVGIESVSEESLRGVGKGFNKVRNYGGLIKAFRDCGVNIYAGIVFGFDHDEPSIFEQTHEFLERNKIVRAMFNVLTPLPGTLLYNQLEAEGRIFDRRWEHYNGQHVVFRPKLMSPETLYEGTAWANHKFYSYPSMLKRLWGAPRLSYTLYFNLLMRGIVKRSLPPGYVHTSPNLGMIQGIRMPKLNLGGLFSAQFSSLKREMLTLQEQMAHMLMVSVHKPSRMPALSFDLDGVLDMKTARTLREMINLAVKNLEMDISLNFKDVNVKPGALRELLVKVSDRVERSKVKIRLHNLDAHVGERLKAIRRDISYRICFPEWGGSP